MTASAARSRTWIKVEDVWAELVDQKPSERYLKQSNRLVNLATKRLRILAGIKGLDETWRIVDEYGEAWDIRGIISNDRQFLILQLAHLT